MPDSSLLSISNSRIDKITCVFNKQTYHLFIQRDDLIHPIISGNKWRKLQQSIHYAQSKELNGIITYGGAYSNHLVASAEACRLYNLECYLFVRGDELSEESNAFLSFCKKAGARLNFINRKEYHTLKYREGMIELDGKRFLSIPEGGADRLGVKGCMEIINPEDSYDIIALAQGTTTTSLGILLGTKSHSEVWCFPVLKGFDSSIEMEKLAIKTGFYKEFVAQKHRLRIFDEYHFGGYAKNQNTVTKDFQQLLNNADFTLDPIYSGKAFIGLITELQKQNVINKRTLFIHTGGVSPNQLIF